MHMSNAEVISKAKYDEVVAAIAERDTLVEEHKDRIAELEYIVEKFKRLLYGRSSEKRAVNVETGAVQELLFEEDESSASAEDEAVDNKPRPRKPTGLRFRGDLEREIVERAVDGVDVIFHHAALASVPRSLELPLDTHHACATGTVNLLDADP